jgi:hypothetical protein
VWSAEVGPEEARTLVEKRDYANFNRLSQASDEAVAELVRMMEDRNLPGLQRYSAAIALGATRSRLAAPALLKALKDPDFNVRRCAAEALPKCSDDDEQVRQALTDLARNDPFTWKDPATGQLRFLVREAAQKALAALPEQSVPLSEVLSGKRVTLVLVKDFLRLENTGPAVEGMEFKRYFPAVDGEQMVVARWMEAQSDAGETIPVSIVGVVADEQGNLIHTYRLGRFPEKQQVLVTVTSVVARRERPAPQGEFPIPPPEAYPAEVRPFLSPTAMVSSDHPEIRKQAEEILARTWDAYQVARELTGLMKARSYRPTKPREAGLPTAVSVLRYGGSCCGSAVCAAAILRACGIPAQITYAPAGYLHGIVRFYLNGYGWVRMDSTSGVGKLPLIQSEEDLGLVRLFDMPIQMEAIWYAYAWPYHHNEERDKYQFRSGGHVNDSIRFAHKGPPAPADGTVAEPFPHLESGSWNRVLGSEPNEGAWQSWEALTQASRAAVMEGTVGEFRTLTTPLPCLAGYIARGRELWNRRIEQ